MGRKPKLGTGTRFRDLKKKLSAKYGSEGAAAIAASIGRKKYGKRKFKRLSQGGKK